MTTAVIGLDSFFFTRYSRFRLDILHFRQQFITLYIFFQFNYTLQYAQTETYKKTFRNNGKPYILLLLLQDISIAHTRTN